MNLLPCPFCGGTNILVDINRARGKMETWCDDCGVCGPDVDMVDALAYLHTPDENRAYAIRLWNTRAVTLTPVLEG